MFSLGLLPLSMLNGIKIRRECDRELSGLKCGMEQAGKRKAKDENDDDDDDDKLNEVLNNKQTN